MRAAVLTVSTTRASGENPDRSGPILVAALRAIGAEVDDSEIVTDELGAISTRLAELCDAGGCDVILTTGGTGLAPDDCTPEATAAVIERQVPGIAEALRADALKHTRHGMLSRGLAGVRGNTLIVNLPGSERACTEGFAVIAPVLTHAAELLSGGDTGH